MSLRGTDTNEAYFDSLASQYDDASEREGHRSDAVFGKMIGGLTVAKNFRSLLDLGVGTGRTTLEATRHIKLDRAVGVDISSVALGIAQRKFRDTELSFEAVHQHTADYLETATEQFDMVSCVSVLNFTGDHDVVFPLIRDRLRRDGAFLFSYVPIIYGHPRLGEPRSTFHHASGMEVIQYYSHPQDILRKLGESGFAIIDQELFCPKPEDPSIVTFMVAAAPTKVP